MLGDLLYRLGSTLGTLEEQLRGSGSSRAATRPREVAVYDTDSGEVFDVAEDADDAIENVAITAAAGWILSRLFRPRPVSWPRVVFAGVVATAVADLVGRTAEEAEPGEEPHAEDPEELMARLGAGVAIAAGYAALLYPRLPGPPLFRGLVFGGLEVLAAPRGGLVRLATGAPGVKFPLQSLALPIDEDAGLTSHLAYGLVLGLLYRDGD